MSSIILKTVWNGSYKQHKNDVSGYDFTLELADDNGNIKGICKEPFVDAFINQPITITGFVDGDLISFIKQYPVYWNLDEHGKPFIDSSKKHPEIHYSGFFDPAYKIYSGNWSMKIGEREDLLGTRIDNNIRGPWIMKLKSLLH